MKRLFFLTLLFTTTVRAGTRYISPGGNDLNDGLSSTTAWKTITKLNSLFNSLAPGDSILFERGGTFYGSIIISRSGENQNPIVFGAYGTGAKPIISGFTTASGFTNKGGNLWESSAIGGAKQPNMVTINNAATDIGRYPNSGWLTFESSVGNSSITDSQLVATPNWTGAEVIIRKNHWTISRDTITNHTGYTISFKGNSSYNSINGYGYFLQNAIAALDMQNEWYFNNTTRKITVYSSSAPTNVKVATVDTLLYVGSYDFITIDNISFQGADVAAVCIGNLIDQSINITIQHCDFDLSGRDAIYGTNDYNCTVTDCTINHSDNNAIYFENEGGKSTNVKVIGNSIKNTGTKPGMGFGDIAYSGIIVLGDSSMIAYNTVDTTGYNPINYYYDGSQVRYNKINYYGYIKDDGAGIYTWTGYTGTPQYAGRKVVGNFVQNGMGAGAGTVDGVNNIHGIYLDDGTTGVTVDSNTVYNIANGGIYIHNTQNSSVTNNWIYNCKSTQLLIVHDNLSPNSPIRNLVLQNNQFVGGPAVVPVVTIRTMRNDVDSFNLSPGGISNNYFCRPFDENFTFRTTRVVSGAQVTNEYTMGTWKSAYPAYVTNTRSSPLTFPNYKLNSLLTANSVTNGQFNSNTGGINAFSSGSNVTISWDNTSQITGTGSVKLTPIASSLRYTILNGSGAGVGAVSASKKYILRVTTRGSGNGSLVAYLRQVASPYSTISTRQYSYFGTAVKVHEFLVTVPANEASATFAFEVQESSGITYLDDVQFYEADATITDYNDKIRFDNNPANTGKSVSLGAKYLSIDSVVLDGAVTMKPYAASIELKTDVLGNNQAPSANAGADRLIHLPTDSLRLSGSGTDTDGTIIGYEWKKVSGPVSGTAVPVNIANPLISDLKQGIYQYELVVMDNHGATAKDTVQVTVNQPPVASAGPDKIISLPVSTVTLSGSGTDSDGTISQYHWQQIAGASAGIANANAANTNVTGLVQGFYTYELTVTDNNGATSKDTLLVTVNTPPVVNAGADTLINLPVSSIGLNGSSTDTDGTVNGYAWRKISGPSAGTVVDPSAPVTSLVNLVQGNYGFELAATDNYGAEGKDTILIRVNALPQANAGGDILVNLPVNNTSLSGSGTDAGGTITRFEWKQITGPSISVIANSGAASTAVSNLEKGIYQYELTVTDNDATTAGDTVQVKVNAAPIANAGADQLINLPENTTTLNGSGLDEDGSIDTYIWTKISGPSNGSITTPQNASTGLTSLSPGVYRYKLNITDNDGGVGADTVQIIVNRPATANAGSDKVVTLPLTNTTLDGSGTDADGTVSSYQWLQLSGPSAATIVNSGTASTPVSNLIAGIYFFELTVADDQGAAGKDTVQVVCNKPPVANAGINQLITLPTTSVMLTGSGTDEDGTVTGYKWMQLAGPSSADIADVNSAATTANNLIPGLYQFELTVTDNNGGWAKQTVFITVNQPPLASAGAAQVINLPVNQASLTGSGSDADGNIAEFTWTQISGPSPATIVSQHAANTEVLNLAHGVYVFQLVVTDNSGASSATTVMVTVNQAPVVNAGVNQLITLPLNTVTLSGNGSDADGSITGYTWVKLGGPASGTILAPGAAVTNLTGLTAGIYQYQLAVTDNNGATATASVQVIVNQPPSADAGADQLITLPVNYTNLAGNGSDGDGTVSSYAWTKISGPAQGLIVSAGTFSTGLQNLVRGIYQFELTVTDNNGGSSKDTLQVTVNAAPVANAGADKLISLPVNTILLNGTGTDADGTISGYTWTKVSGPSTGNIQTPSSASTSVNNLTQGVYQYELVVADNNGAFGKDTVQVTVNAVPVANAGADKLINLPVNSTSLSGAGTDADGTIASYLWRKLSGPSAGNIATPTTLSTSIDNLSQGIYQFELTVTDNNGAAGKDTLQVIVNAPPIASAGGDKLISLPVNTTTLSGAGTDADGTISSYVWVKVSGPAPGNILTPNLAGTSINGLVQGVYQYEITVTDNNGAIGKDSVQITVNVAPVANAGADKLISLPINTTNLSGSGSDADGTITGYSWAKVAGPASGTIAAPTAASTSINNLTQGVYQYELTITDNNGAIGKDTVQIIVNAAPVGNAGADKLINLPINTTSLTASGTDIDGTIASYSWAKISGPASGNIATPNIASTTINNLTQGVYQYELTIVDNNGATGKDTVQVTVNAAPIANAGTDKLINLPINTTSLSGSGTDADGTIASYAWAKVSGPASGTIAAPNAASTSINNLTQGIYQFELAITDNNGAIGKDTIQVTVNAAPVAIAGADKLINLPTSTTTFAGAGTDTDGTIASYAWAKVSGPAAGTIATPTAASTSVNNLTQGIYQFELTITDNNGAIGKDTIQVTVNAAPVASAGADKLINLPINTTTLTGSGTDADGTIASYAWAKVSGPVAGTIATPTAASTSVNSLTQGVYQYELTITDNNGAIGKDTVQVIVNAAPVANAGADKLINLPINTTNLSGSGTDADGTIASYAWAKISGPASAAIATPTAASTSINGLTQGIYQFELTIADNNGATGKDTVQVTVNAAPVVNAGADKLINLPINTTSLTGSGTDADGTISSYSWIKISGPASATIATPTAASTSINNLTQGIYQFELTITDNNGAIGKDTVQVTVNAAPIASAGADKLINLPTNTTTLTGSGSDSDGTIAGYAWAKISGPVSGVIATPNASGTQLTGLIQGIYQFQLTVTDNNSSTGKDTIQVTVNAAPTANAGADKLINLPINTTTLTGSGTDADGTIANYSWTKISGPAAGNIGTANAASTSINNLTQGIYQFELSIADNNGAIGKDTVQVTVNATPVANAGADKLINLPINTTTLTGSGTDADGTIASYAWAKVSGPASGTIATPTAASTLINNLTQGVYQYELTITDNNGAVGKDTVQVTVNAAPIANAGADKLINLPANTATLTGGGSDADGTITGSAWSKISGPASGAIATPGALSTQLTGLVQGIYQFQLIVTDNNAGIGKDTIQVTVNAAPVANAGADKLISLPTNTTTLTGSGIDADGTIASYSWTKVSGPAAGTIGTANAASTSINNLTQGIYQFELSITDNNGAIGKDTVQVTVNATPVANAGVDKLINLPINTTSLSGSGTDADGTIANYLWTKISGPASGTIATPNATSTSINNLTQGIYQFELSIADNNGAIGKDTVQVIVNATPVANAGADKLINLPINTTTLTGNGTDADGTIASYSWAKVSGPASGNIATPNTASTTINNLTQGVYQYELNITDNNGAIGKDTVQVIVNATPTANAGADKLINLPTNTTTLAGGGSDADGSIAGYAWAKISGPVSGTIATPNASSTQLTGLVQGIYQFQLMVTDNNGGTGKDTIQVTVNAAPVANAGADKLISLPTNTTTLTGSGTDADGTIASYSWAKVSGPASGNIATPNTASTTINNLTQGVYQYELTIIDNNGATGKDTVQVTVNAAPIANAGTDKLINLPINTTSLSGSGTDADGTIASYAWVKVSGPASGTIVAPNAASTSINNLTQGIYQFELAITDNNGAIGKDTIQVTVNAAPVASAGADKLINLPINTTTLTGSGADADGTIASYAWAKVSGPAAGTIATPTAASTSVNSLTQGVYQYELTITDNNGAIGKDTVQVIVNAAPVANAGADKLINLPINTTNLSGSGTDADGTIASYAWAKVSGPASGTIATPTAASTSVNSLTQGVYQYELTITDNNGAIGKDTVQVIVNAAPVANAGADKVINLPINTTNLSGSGTDADGTIASYAWAKVSGPASGTIATPTAASTSINGLTQGVYQFELTITDNNGAIGKDTVQVTVNATPIVNAGADKLINLPINTTTLTGSGTDADGTIASYSWIKISGPASATIATPTAASTSINNLTQGIYQFELAITDNNGAIGKDTVQVTVNAAPIASAGADKLINLPTNTTTLTGSGSDSDGTIAGYAWAKISGPVSGVIATPNASGTQLTGLVQGIYQFQLTVTDNNSSTGKDTIQVTVNAAPLANAGTDKLINLPINTTNLTGSGADADGTISSYTWSKISGPAAGTIATPGTASTALNALVQGVYLFQLLITDNNGATGKDTAQVIVNAVPVANAGTDKVINLPTNTSTLTGSGTDADGTISSYAWSRVSGPATGTIATPGTAVTNLTGLVQGVYLFQLLITDNNGATAKDTAQVTVNASNIAPVANAGADKLINLPASSVTLTGSATDADGTISAYAWLKIAGPATGTIASPNAASTLLNSLTQGTYQYQLTVTDNGGATAKDTIQVIVNALPVINAGIDKVVNLPINTSSLTGTVTDADGTISSYAWSKIAGPATGTITTPAAATTTLSALVQGTYQFQLIATDNRGANARDTVQVIVNAAPVSNAGIDKLIVLPANTISLTGAGTDADGTISTYAWLKIAGPATGTIVSPAAAITSLTSLVLGVYQFQLTVTDNLGSTGKDTVQVTVNTAPVASAGVDKLISLPVNSSSLAGTGTDADGTISSYIWVKIAGPATGTIVSPSAASTTLTSLVQGTYQFQLTVTDDRGTTGKDTMQLIVNAPPIVNAGVDKLVTPPANSSSLTGTATDVDGTISSYAWLKISGPATGTIGSPAGATTSLTNLVRGIYQYQLTVTDNRGATTKDTVQVTVNRLPVVNAGVDKLITLPVNTTTLTGTATDPDGTISSYAWLKITGPATGTIVSPAAATTALNNLVQGTYQFQLTATDNTGSSVKDTIQVIVNAPPVPNAGVDKVVTLPVNTTSITGSATDTDGTIATYAWLKISGPAGGTVASPSVATTQLNSLAQGVYQYQLTVTDNRGATGKDTVRVTVNPAGQTFVINLRTKKTRIDDWPSSTIDGEKTGGVDYVSESEITVADEKVSNLNIW